MCSVLNEILVIKKNEIVPFAAKWMNMKIIILSEVKEKHYMISLIYGIKKKVPKKNLIYKTEIDSQTQQTNFWLPKRKEMGRDKLGV